MLNIKGAAPSGQRGGLSGLKYGLTTASLIAICAAVPALAQAQEATQTESTVIVTGLRGSLARASALKRNEAAIVEAITAEEIGKLPDNSIAESLARLPGIAGQRVNGDVQVLNIRGTSPDFTVTTFNGRQQGSLGDGRGVEVDQYPSELINGVMVYKTPDASVAGQGLSGTVDLRTIRPLRLNGRSMMVNFRLSTDSLSDLNPEANPMGWRGSFSYVNQYLDGRLGVAFGYAHMDETRQTEHQKIWGWRNCGQNVSGGSTNCLPTNTVHNALGPTGFEVRAISNNRVRDGLMGVIEFQPNDNSHTIIDLYYSHYTQEEVMRGFETYSEWGVDNLTIPTGTIAQSGGSNYLATAQLVGLSPFLNNQLHTRDDTLLSGGINHQMHAGIWDLTFDAAYSRAEGDAQNIQITGGYGATRTPDPINMTTNLDGFTQFDPGLNYADANQIYLGDNASWGGWGQEGFRTLPHVEDSYTSFAFSGRTNLENSWAGGLFSSFELGVNFTNHDKEKSSTDEDLCLRTFSTANTALSTDGGSQCTPVGLSYRKRSTSPITSNGVADLGFAGFGGIAAFDILSTMNSQYNILQRRDSNAYNRNWSLNEQVTTLYARFNIDTDLHGHRLRGNLGLQFVDTATESTGFAVTNASNNPTSPNYNTPPTLLTVTNAYTDVLPSLNLSLNVTDSLMVRVGAAQQMARPRPDQMRASVNASLNLASNNSADPNFGKYRWGGNAGNPLLDPWRAASYDVSVEYYLNSRSYVAVAGFYKDVETYIYSQNVAFDFSAIPNPTNLPLVSNIGNLSVMENGQGGYIKGIEVSANLDFGTFMPLLEGFGFSGSYAHNYTDISPDGPTSTNTLPGFSGEQRNLTLYYERYGFSARVSDRWRSAFRSDVAGLFADRSFSEILADEQVDAQIAYRFNEGPFAGLNLVLEANNLTDTLYRTRTGAKTADGTYLPETTDRYGTSYRFGFSYRF